jgi:hypothetical protein
LGSQAVPPAKEQPAKQLVFFAIVSLYTSKADITFIISQEFKKINDFVGILLDSKKMA